MCVGGRVSNANTRNCNPFLLTKPGDMRDQEGPLEKPHSWTDEGRVHRTHLHPKHGHMVSRRLLLGQKAGGGGYVLCEIDLKY